MSTTPIPTAEASADHAVSGQRKQPDSDNIILAESLRSIYQSSVCRRQGIYSYSAINAHALLWSTGAVLSSAAGNWRAGAQSGHNGAQKCKGCLMLCPEKDPLPRRSVLCNRQV